MNAVAAAAAGAAGHNHAAATAVASDGNDDDIILSLPIKTSSSTDWQHATSAHAQQYTTAGYTPHAVILFWAFPNHNTILDTLFATAA